VSCRNARPHAVYDLALDSRKITTLISKLEAQMPQPVSDLSSVLKILYGRKRFSFNYSHMNSLYLGKD
jgi:hypothetical protein